MGSAHTFLPSRSTGMTGCGTGWALAENPYRRCELIFIDTTLMDLVDPNGDFKKMRMLARLTEVSGGHLLNPWGSRSPHEAACPSIASCVSKRTPHAINTHR